MDNGRQGSGSGSHSLVQRLARSLDLPQDVVLDLPKVTLIGNLQLLIENHRGILEYTSECVRVRTAYGQVVVTGLRLKIGSILPQEVVIDGRIGQIDFR